LLLTISVNLSPEITEQGHGHFRSYNNSFEAFASSIIRPFNYIVICRKYLFNGFESLHSFPLLD